MSTRCCTKPPGRGRAPRRGIAHARPRVGTRRAEWVVRRDNQRLDRAARAIVRNDAEAEDVTQQAYVNAYVNLAQFEGRAKFATWLTRIAVHEALGRVRRQTRARIAYSPMEDPMEDPVDTLESRELDPERLAFSSELRTVLESAIDALADGHRTGFMMREVEGLSTAETADCLELSEGAG